ncbi:helix-turn-helix transcriptional regulator [Hymenobacter lutimineralis]|uniref:Helix-turn-helix transcriptional regulator n=1 Tax=Hymenobacter lutimineralis TaxID=2606448 RepID=A0A5D6VI49_9BACT|nr:helix-turn-helix transcriptional regulator [Hymenobacter lutimineralis]TYZ14398.1 helix-turn-helix transcriptional regulator [Hymenobacter lutimineralis]
MPKPVSSLSPEAAIRAHFGLTQEELARYLGVSRGQVGHQETGRRPASAKAALRLTRLGRLLPPPEGFGPPAPTSTYAPPPVPAALFGAELPLPAGLAASPIRQRQRQCARRLALLRRDLHVLTSRTTGYERRRWALPVLETALTPHPADPAAAEHAEQAHLRRWLDELAATLPPAPALRPDADTALALLVVRLAALEAEAATLVHLLARAAT